MVTLVFVAVLLLAVGLDHWVIRPWEKRHRPRPTAGGDDRAEFVVPRTLFFHPGHTWARLDGDGRVTVGVDDLARTLIGDLSTVELPAVGTPVSSGLPIFAVRQGPRRLTFAAPVSGTVAEVNSVLGRDPVRLRWRPYKEGWVVRLAPGERLSSELSGLTIGADAERWMRSELARLDLLFERGLLCSPVEGALERSQDDSWALFERQVLKLGGEQEGRTA